MKKNKNIEESLSKDLIIVRGIPGSGKSNFAELLGTKAICCADDYHVHNGEYLWKAKAMGRAHEWCQRKCAKFMKRQVERIVVTNTNTTERELKIYYDLARNFGYKVFSVIIENRHDGINIHDVPVETLEKMRNRFTIKL